MMAFIRRTCSKLASMSSSNCNIAAPSLNHNPTSMQLYSSTRTSHIRLKLVSVNDVVASTRISSFTHTLTSKLRSTQREKQHLSKCSAVDQTSDPMSRLADSESGQETKFAESVLSGSSELQSMKPRWMAKVSKHLRPYGELIRADKLIGGPWLFLWPFYWGIALAARNGSGPDLEVLGLLGVAAVLLRNFAMVINDLCDMDVDGKVERSKSRPLITGAVTPLQAWVFAGAHIFLYMAIILQTKTFSEVQVSLGAIQLLLNCAYPLSKRWTCWTPACLGLAINWGAFLGWATVRGTEGLMYTMFPPFLAACCWTMVYETIYAYQDVKDDAKAGIKSITSVFDKNTRSLWLTSFTSVFAASLCFTGFIAKLGWPFYVAVGAAAGHLAWQFMSVDFKNSADLATKFNSNKWVGAIVFGGIMCGKLVGFV